MSQIQICLIVTTLHGFATSNIVGMVGNVTVKKAPPMLASLDLLEPKQRSRLRRLATTIQAQFLRDCLHPMGKFLPLWLSLGTCSVITLSNIECLIPWFSWIQFWGGNLWISSTTMVNSPSTASSIKLLCIWQLQITAWLTIWFGVVTTFGSLSHHRFLQKSLL